MKGLPKELETVVRDLWGLRLGALKGVGEKGRSVGGGYSSGTGTQVGGYSSMSEGETSGGWGTDGSAGGRSLGSRRSGESGSRRSGKAGGDAMKDKLPKLGETLGLLYLGCLLLRLPLSLGELVKWVKRDEIVYNRAVSLFSLELVGLLLIWN